MRRVQAQTVSSLPARLLLLAAVLLSPESLAWGAMGHELASQLAAGQLSDRARARVRELLGQETLAEASTWPDRMRSNPAPFWQEEAGPYHYVTVPPGLSYADLGPPPQGDAISALSRFRAELLDPEVPLARRQLALRFAVHIVQDLQQPLHAGNGEDRGGNDIAVIVNGEPSDLHWLWDSQILASSGRSRPQWFQHFRESGLLDQPGSRDANPLQWVAESSALRDTLYPPPRVADSAYLQRMLPRAEQRLALAATRTAAWLNEVLGSP